MPVSGSCSCRSRGQLCSEALGTRRIDLWVCGRTESVGFRHHEPLESREAGPWGPKESGEGQGMRRLGETTAQRLQAPSGPLGQGFSQAASQGGAFTDPGQRPEDAPLPRAPVNGLRPHTHTNPPTQRQPRGMGSAWSTALPVPPASPQMVPRLPEPSRGSMSHPPGPQSPQDQPGLGGLLPTPLGPWQLLSQPWPPPCGFLAGPPPPKHVLCFLSAATPLTSQPPRSSPALSQRFLGTTLGRLLIRFICPTRVYRFTSRWVLQGPQC